MTGARKRRLLVGALALLAWAWPSAGCRDGASDLWVVSVAQGVADSTTRDVHAAALLEKLRDEGGWSPSGSLATDDRTRLLVSSTLDRRDVERELGQLFGKTVEAVRYTGPPESAGLLVEIDRRVLDTRGLVLDDVANAITSAGPGARTVGALGAVTLATGADGPFPLARAARITGGDAAASAWTDVIWIEASDAAVANEVARGLVTALGSRVRARAVPRATVRAVAAVDVYRAREAGVDPRVAEGSLRRAMERERVLGGSPRIVLRTDPLGLAQAQGMAIATSDGRSVAASTVIELGQTNSATEPRARTESGAAVAFVVVWSTSAPTLEALLRSHVSGPHAVVLARQGMPARQVALVELALALSPPDELILGRARQPRPRPPPRPIEPGVYVMTPGGFADVYDEHGRHLGMTPLRAALPVGPHRLTLRSLQGERPSVTETVVVEPGAVTRVLRVMPD